MLFFKLKQNYSAIYIIIYTCLKYTYIYNLKQLYFLYLQGGVILVSHDERLIRMVCKELWVCGNGSVKSIEGGFDEYRKIVERELEAQNK